MRSFSCIYLKEEVARDQQTDNAGAKVNPRRFMDPLTLRPLHRHVVKAVEGEVDDE